MVLRYATVTAILLASLSSLRRIDSGEGLAVRCSYPHYSAVSQYRIEAIVSNDESRQGFAGKAGVKCEVCLRQGYKLEKGKM